jgi:hypothetical protein
MNNTIKPANEMTSKFAPSTLCLVMLYGQEKAAQSLIGEMVRDGKTVYFVNEVDRVGRYTGKMIEGDKFELVRHCIKNRYV